MKEKFETLIFQAVFPASAAKIFGVDTNSYLHKNIRQTAREAAEKCASLVESPEKFGGRDIDSLTKKEYEEISMIFLPQENFKLKFASFWEHTRENVGRHIIADNIPVSFDLSKYFALYKYLESKGIKAI